MLISTLLRNRWLAVYTACMAVLLVFWVSFAFSASSDSDQRSWTQILKKELADEQVITTPWLAAARQLVPDLKDGNAAHQNVMTLWSQQLDDVDALLKNAVKVLNPDQIQMLRVLLHPQLDAKHTQTQLLTKQLDAKLLHLLDAGAPPGQSKPMPLTWQRLERLHADLRLIMDTVRELRLLSYSRQVAYEDKLSLSFFNQMAVTFPSEAVRDMEAQAQRMTQRRWSLLQLLDKHEVPSAPGVTASKWDVWVVLWLVFCLLGVGWLWRQQKDTVRWQHQHQLAAQTVDALQVQLRQLQENATHKTAEQPPAPPPSVAASPSWAQDIRRDLPGMRARLKNIQLRFDSGQSLETAMQDVRILDDQLQRWDALLTQETETHGGEHG